MYLIIQLLDKQCFRNNHAPVSCRAECKIPVWAPLCRGVWRRYDRYRILKFKCVKFMSRLRNQDLARYTAFRISHPRHLHYRTLLCI